MKKKVTLSFYMRHQKIVARWFLGRNAQKRSFSEYSSARNIQKSKSPTKVHVNESKNLALSGEKVRLTFIDPSLRPGLSFYSAWNQALLLTVRSHLGILQNLYKKPGNLKEESDLSVGLINIYKYVW